MNYKELKSTAMRRKLTYDQMKILVGLFGSSAVWIDYYDYDKLVTDDWYLQCSNCTKRWVLSRRAKQDVMEKYFNMWHCEKGKLCKVICPKCKSGLSTS